MQKYCRQEKNNKEKTAKYNETLVKLNIVLAVIQIIKEFIM
ncbi:TPA: hypothetical protein ACKFTO_002724 [Staphylococcus aureus]